MTLYRNIKNVGVLFLLSTVLLSAAEKADEWVWPKLIRPTQVWDPQIDDSAPQETVRVRIVDFGQANCRWNNKVGYGYTTGSRAKDFTNIYDRDVDNNPATKDWIQTIPFSLKTTALSPHVPQFDRSWDSAIFAGGLSLISAGRTNKKDGFTEKYTNTAEGDELMKPGCNWAVHAQRKVVGSPLRAYFVPIWRKQEFPHLGNRYPVSFDETSTIGLYTQRFWSGFEGFRFVVQDSGQLYLSEVLPNNFRHSIGGTSAWDKRITLPLNQKWATWDVQEGDWDLQLTNTVFEQRTFTNIEGIGFYLFKDAFDDTEVACKWECFEAYANVTRPTMPSETIDMKTVTADGTSLYMASCETPYEVWKRIFRMSRSIGQFVFDEEPGMLYDRFGTMGSVRFSDTAHSQAEPVTDLTLHDMIAWCNALSEYEGREFVYYTTPDFQTGSEYRYALRGAWHKDTSIYEKKDIYVKWSSDGFRLPTPSEWIAATGTDTGWVGDNSKSSTHPVGSMPANEQGIYDMQGNVWEMLWTWGDKLPAQPQALVVAGGDFHTPADPLEHAASPYGDAPFRGSYNIGFRFMRREKNSPKPNLDFQAADFSAPLWTITPDTRTQTHSASTVEIPLADIPAGKLFTYNMTAFQMGTHEITYRQWKQVFDWAQAHGYSFDSDGDMGSMDHRLYTIDTYTADEPVTDVSYFDMLAWCNALSEMHGRTPVFYADKEKTKVYKTAYRYRQSQLMNRHYPEKHSPEAEKGNGVYSWDTVPNRRVWIRWEANGYRLPSVHEWLYAYNAGATTAFPWGEEFKTVTDHGWVYANANARTHPIGQKQANAFGLFDMVGNVVELCVDSVGKSGSFEKGQKTNPLTKFHSYVFNAKTRATFRQTGLVHYNRAGFGTAHKKLNVPKHAGVIPGWYWADCGLRIIARETGDYPPEGIDPGTKQKAHTPLNLKRIPGAKK